MEALNTLIAILLLLSAAGGAWLTRVNQKQAQRIVDLEDDLADMTNQRDTESRKQLDWYHKGWNACEERWRGMPLYQKGYQAALVEQAGVACEMEELRRSGELGQTVKEPVSA